MIRLALAGPHTLQTSTLCAHCPHGRAGCCAAPPAVAWADLGRIVSLGGLRFLLDELRAGRLRPAARGLSILRVPATRDEKGEWPARCVYLGPAGCALPPERRSATCNYYLCDEAFVDVGEAALPLASAGRRAQEALTLLFGRWDLELDQRMKARGQEEPPWSEGFFEWLGHEYERLARRHRRQLRRLNF